MRRLASALLVLLLACPAAASACPLIDGLVDSNCDGILKIGFAGDSFVKGTGDKSELGGGYVSRIALHYPNAVVVKYSQPGAESGLLLSRLMRRVPRMKSGPAEKNLYDSDILIIDVGRNDFWRDNNPATTIGNIARIVKYLTSELAKRGSTAPVIAVSTLAPTTRSIQAPFVSAVNALLTTSRKKTLPVYLRTDLIRSSLISPDGLHPNSLGYEAIAEIIKTYIDSRAQTRAISVCKDEDGDGVYDKFEATKFGTNAALTDTDADSFGDGDEIFAFATDPIDPQSHP